MDRAVRRRSGASLSQRLNYPRSKTPYDDSCDNRYSAIAFIGGFCLFVLVSQLMG